MKNSSISVDSLAFSPDGKIMIANVHVWGLKCRMYVWHVYEKRLLGTLGDSPDSIQHILFSSDGCWVLTSPHKNDVFIWDLHGCQHISTLSGHLGGATCIAVSHSMLVASGTLDGTIYLWSLPDGQKIATLKEHNQRIECLSFSRDNGLLFSADSSGQALLWRVDVPSEPVCVSVYSSPYGVGAVHWSAARRIVLSDRNAPLHFYHLALEGDWERAVSAKRT